MSDKEKRLEQKVPSSKKPLFLPVVNGKGFTKAEIELLQELDPDIKVLPDGSYTINGETPAEINRNYEKTTKQLTSTKQTDSERER